MPTSNSNRSVASTSAHSANATPWLKSALHQRDARRSLLTNTAACTLELSRRAHRHLLRAQSIPSAYLE
jgi:hypothetical protein